ncbi:MAG: EAL domain-containing protein [Acetatifactor sp.]
MNTANAQPKLTLEELDVILDRYLPSDVLEQAKSTIHDIFHENGQVDLWKYRDRMTGMYNTQGILKILNDWKTPCMEAGENILILCIDVDRLENINRIYGHSEGDVVIQTLGQILEDSITENEICGHLGSSEFAIMIRTASTEEHLADSFLHSINFRIDNYNRVSGKEYSFHITHSISLITPEPNTNMSEVLDKVLSKKRLQKEGRRNLTDNSQEQSIDPEEHRLVNKVLDHNLFRYAFQPIVDAKTGEIYAYEALMRTEAGIPFSPLVILKYATFDDRLYDIERATFFNVLQQMASIPDLGERKVFINSIPTCQLVPADYNKLRATYGSLFENMIVEITEQTELDDDKLELMLTRSREDGFGLAIDDYGTGYSNTSSLLRYLPNCVKIDRLLIAGIEENPKKQHFVNNIITFAHDNGFLALAEGVETAAELKAVIHMGIDLIQGFYTAKPSFTMLKELPEALKNEIISDNMGMHEKVQRKIYIVNDEHELVLMKLALEQYTGIVVAQPELTLIGNPNFPAGMSIKIKDGCQCRLTLRNINLESTEDLPCIDIGNGAGLTLILEGSNVLSKTGIRIPEGSVCRLSGSGDLSVSVKGINCYAIGNDANSGVGTIICDSSGKLIVRTEGNHCINIGGGIYRQGEGIQILRGDIRLNVAGEKAMGIGCCTGSVPILVRDCALNIDFRVASGCAIGSLNSAQQIKMMNMNLKIDGSGSHLSGIGSIENTSGEITVENAEAHVRLTGQKVRLIGNEGGGLNITVNNTHMTLNGEGTNVLGIGCFDESCILTARDSTLDIHLLAAENIAIGARDENCTFEGGKRILLIND